jgi:hypothetical protein
MGDAQVTHLGMGMEVIQGSEAGDNRGQRSRNIGITGIREMVLSTHPVAMDFRMERLCHLASGSAEVHEETTLRHMVEFETLLNQPLGNLLHVVARGPKSLPELLRCEPLVELSSARIILPADELLQFQFLGLAAPQHHQDVAQRLVVGGSAAVKAWTGSWVAVPR